MDEHQRKALIDIYQAYRKNNIVRANDITNNLPSHITDFLISNFDYRNRPKEFSSGALGANTWIAFSNELKSMGYSDTVSLIIPLVVLDNYNEVLDKIIDKENDK